MIASWGQPSHSQLLPLIHTRPPSAARVWQLYSCSPNAHTHMQTQAERAAAHVLQRTNAGACKHTETETLKQPCRLYLYKQRFCWSCAADLLFHCLCRLYFDYLFISVVLNNSCLAPADLSFSVTVALLPPSISLSLFPFVISLSLPAAALFSSLSLSAFCHVSLPERQSKQCFLSVSYSHCLPWLAPTVSPLPPFDLQCLSFYFLTSFFFPKALPLLSITGVSCWSVCLLAVWKERGGRCRGRVLACREDELALKLASDWQRGAQS